MTILYKRQFKYVPTFFTLVLALPCLSLIEISSFNLFYPSLMYLIRGGRHQGILAQRSIKKFCYLLNLTHGTEKWPSFYIEIVLSEGRPEAPDFSLPGHLIASSQTSFLGRSLMTKSPSQGGKFEFAVKISRQIIKNSEICQEFQFWASKNCPRTGILDQFRCFSRFALKFCLQIQISRPDLGIWSFGTFPRNKDSRASRGVPAIKNPASLAFLQIVLSLYSLIFPGMATTTQSAKIL